MTDPDVAAAHRHIDRLCDTARHLRAHLADLHNLAWEPTVAERLNIDDDQRGKTDWTPRSGSPAARKLFDRIADRAAAVASEFVGLDRQMVGLFRAGTDRAEPTGSRSMISAGEHARLLANQTGRVAAGEFTPVRLDDQTPHPGKHR